MNTFYVCVCMWLCVCDGEAGHSNCPEDMHIKF